MSDISRKTDSHLRIFPPAAFDLVFEKRRFFIAIPFLPFYEYYAEKQFFTNMPDNKRFADRFETYLIKYSTYSIKYQKTIIKSFLKRVIIFKDRIELQFRSVETDGAYKVQLPGAKNCKNCCIFPLAAY